MQIQPVILAGGKGTRLKSDLPKALFCIHGKPMIHHIIDQLDATKHFLKPIIVIGHNGETVQKALGDTYTYALQTELTGTATAVKTAVPFLSLEHPTFVLFADNPFITHESMERMCAYFLHHTPTLAFFTTTVSDFEEWRAPFASFGRVLRTPQGTLERIVEHKHATDDERATREVVPGGFCFDTRWLIDAIATIEPNKETGEYYLTDLIHMAIMQNRNVGTVPLPEEEALGINSVADAEHSQRRMG